MRVLLLLVLAVGASALQLGVRPTLNRAALRSAISMQEEPAAEGAPPPAEAAATDKAGNVYDDEYEDPVLANKPELSNSMRKRLIEESRGLGADPNSKNPFLPVFFGVGVFVLLGALAVNM